MSSSKTLLSVGSMAFDQIETPFGKTDKVLGGAATYIGLASSHFNINCGLVSVVGGDFPNEYLKLLSDKKINIDGVEQVNNGKTFFWKGRYHNDLNRRDTLITELNVLEHFNPKVPNHFNSPSILMLGNLHPAVQNSVIDQMVKQPKLIVLDTMNFWIESALEDLKKVLKRTDLLTVNEEEARQLSGEYSLLKAAQSISKLGPKYVIIKKGEHGALLFNNDNVFVLPGLPLEEIYDPTGAGDTFAGGLCGFLVNVDTLSFNAIKQGIVYGSSLASFCVEKFGVERLLEISMSDIIERVSQFQMMTQYEIEMT